ncbi:MAG: DUF4870 domain-containing protein [Chloroflexi bacterium]|jgi:uncharacterized membrane protein|nr:DUF4870 domain-containing protein [Chloroflexota bacterium]
MSDESQNASEQPFGLGETPTPPTTPAGPLTENEKLLSGLSWVSQLLIPAVLPIILLLTDESKRSAFVKHHAVQSLGMAGAAVIYEIAAAIVFAILTAITGGLLGCILWIIFLAPILPLVYYGIQAFQGKYVTIPYLTEFLQRNNWL